MPGCWMSSLTAQCHTNSPLSFKEICPWVGVQGHMSGGWGEPSEVVSVDSGLEARDSDPPGACFNVDICIHNFFLWIFFLFVILLSICYHLLVLSTNAFSQLQGIVLKVESVQSSDNLGMGLPSRFTVFFFFHCNSFNFIQPTTRFP